MKLTPRLLQLASDMLREYSDDLSNNGCNDMILKDTPENRELEALVIEWSGDPEMTPREPRGGVFCLYDWMVAGLLADLLKGE